MYATCYPSAPLSFLSPHLCCISMRDPERSRSQEPVSTSARLESTSIPLWRLQIIGAGRVPQHGTSTCPKVSCSISILLKECSQTSTWKTWQECAVWVEVLCWRCWIMTRLTASISCNSIISNLGVRFGEAIGVVMCNDQRFSDWAVASIWLLQDSNHSDSDWIEIYDFMTSVTLTYLDNVSQEQSR